MLWSPYGLCLWLYPYDQWTMTGVSVGHMSAIRLVRMLFFIRFGYSRNLPPRSWHLKNVTEEYPPRKFTSESLAQNIVFQGKFPLDILSLD